MAFSVVRSQRLLHFISVINKVITGKTSARLVRYNTKNIYYIGMFQTQPVSGHISSRKIIVLPQSAIIQFLYLLKFYF